MKISIRSAKEEDAESIVELLNPIIQAGKYTILDKQLSIDDQTDFIRRFPERGVFHVAVCNDSQKILGIQDVMPISKDIHALAHVGEIATFVSVDSHRKGFGRNLSQATFRAASEKGYKKIMATIRADNPQAVAFYRNQGFRVIGTAQNHALVGGEYIDEIVTEKLIG